STYGTQLIDCSTLGAHEDPALGAAAAGVELGRIPPDLPEDLLQDFFGDARVAQDAPNQTERHTGQRVIEAAERLPSSFGDSGDQAGNVLRPESLERHDQVMSNRRLTSGQHIGVTRSSHSR